jgi:hypothetical protein
MGERATEMAQGTIKEVLGDADLVFVTAGMGGGTGTGAAPVVSKIAKEQGAIVVGMVSTPFNVERARTVKAEEGLERLREEADSIIVLDNNRLLDYVPNLPIGKAFSVMDQIIAETVKGISETITQPSLINLDYADMTSIMNQGGVAVMLVGETQDKNKTEEVVKDAMNHPLLDVDYRGASGGLVHITGGPDLTLQEGECQRHLGRPHPGRVQGQGSRHGHHDRRQECPGARPDDPETGRQVTAGDSGRRRRGGIRRGNERPAVQPRLRRDRRRPRGDRTEERARRRPNRVTRYSQPSAFSYGRVTRVDNVYSDV